MEVLKVMIPKDLKTWLKIQSAIEKKDMTEIVTGLLRDYQNKIKTASS